MQPRTDFDVIVVGLGATGGATTYHLAKQGARVLGLDRFSPPHAHGSSHGHTRIYRQAYYEAPDYVPLALRALELWHELERDTGDTLFANTGVLTIGREESEILSGALQSAREHGIAHELLSSDDMVRRFPAFRPPTEAVALFEPTGGVLFADKCVAAHLALARAHGAAVHTGETVTHIEHRDDHTAIVRTDAGSYSAERVVVAAGAWSPALLGLESAFRVTRESVHWFDALSDVVNAATCPVSLIAMDDGRMLYTIPDFGDGFKAGLHHTGVEASADTPGTPIDEAERAGVIAALERYVPDGAGTVRDSMHCYYTSTEDFHFAVGPMPLAPNIILAAACSGHGFKFAPALGESLASLARGTSAALPMDVFDVGRLTR
jgi:sarcosine oxidase